MVDIDFQNSTDLDGSLIHAAILRAVEGWRVRGTSVRVRYSRGADFSGTCFYQDRRIFINLGRHLKYPYAMRTNLARAVTQGRRWWRPVYVLHLRDGHQVVMFVFLHELYHLLVKVARRNTRQKESMCDRFAARYMVDHFGLSVRTDRGLPVARDEWDYQDLLGFVAAARDRRTATKHLATGQVAIKRAAVRPMKSSQGGARAAKVTPPNPTIARQLVLFPP